LALSPKHCLKDDVSMSKYKPDNSKSLVLDGRRVSPANIPATAISKTIFLGLTAGARAKFEKSLAVAEEARLRRVIASEEIAYRQTTIDERWTRRMQAEDESAALSSLENMTAQDQLLLERDQIAYARQNTKLEAQLENNRLTRALEADEAEEDEGITVEELAENLTILKSYIEGLKADKKALMEGGGEDQDGTWQQVQELSNNITHYDALYREMHSNYTKHVLGIV
jgi:hypothetical protein